MTYLSREGSQMLYLVSSFYFMECRKMGTGKNYMEFWSVFHEYYISNSPN